jgi:hypothetical protein
LRSGALGTLRLNAEGDSNCWRLPSAMKKTGVAARDRRDFAGPRVSRGNGQGIQEAKYLVIEGRSCFGGLFPVLFIVSLVFGWTRRRR